MLPNASPFLTHEDTMNVTEKIIKAVEERPYLWDKSNVLYKNRKAINKGWDEVSQAVNLSKDEARRKWRGLRDMFVKELKKYSNEIKEGIRSSNSFDNFGWRYFQSLYFLKDMVPNTNETEQDVTEYESMIKDEYIECDVNEDYEVETLENENWSDYSNEAYINTGEPIVKRSVDAKTTNKRSILEPDVEVPMKRSKKEDPSNDEDMLFVKSLVPYLKHFDAITKLRLKSKIQNLIADEMSAYNSLRT